jgi:hypothetical protein
VRTIILFIAAAALLGLGLSQASAQTPPAKTVTVVMHDPGCHWFSANGKFLRSLSVTGPVRLANFDENVLLVSSRSGVVKAPVGKRITLGSGIYHITMVKQAPDDNHLKLVVK